MSVAVNDLEHHLSLVRRDFLSVSAVRHGLVLVVLQTNVTKLIIRNVLHVNPLHFKLTFEFVLNPNVAGRVMVNSAQHLQIKSTINKDKFNLTF